MNFNIFLKQILLLCLTSVSACAIEAYGPGLCEVESRQLPIPEWEEPISLDAYGGVQLSFTSSHVQPSENSPELTELARGLKYQPLEILNYVRNNFDYEPYYGFVKGPLQTYLEEAGNDLDLSMLVVKLLEISKLHNSDVGQIQIARGLTTISANELSRWLGCDDESNVIDYALGKCRIPYQKNDDLSYSIARFWVRMEYEGQHSNFDPAAIPSELVLGLPLENLINFDLDELLLLAGGTVTDDSVSALDTNAINDYMSEIALSYRDYLKLHHDNEHLISIIGGEERTRRMLKSLSLPEEATYVVSNLLDPSSLPDELIASICIELGDLYFAAKLPEINAKNLFINFQDSESIPSTVVGDFGIQIQGEPSGTQEIIHTRIVIGETLAEIEPANSAFALVGDNGQLYSTYIYDDEVQLPNSPLAEAIVPVQMLTNTVPGDYSALLTLTQLIDGRKSSIVDQVVLRGTVLPQRAALVLEGVTVASESTSSSYENKLKISIQHPAWDSEQELETSISRKGSYSIVSAFGGNDSQKRMAYSQRRYKKMEAGDENPDLVVAASRDTVGQHWFKASRQFTNLFESLTNTKKLYFHRVGIVGQSPKGYFIDVAAQLMATIPRSLEALSNVEELQFVNMYTESALEHQSLEQLQGYHDAISTTKIFDVANSAGVTIYRIDSNNVSDVSNRLSGYNNDSIQTAVEDGAVLVLPETAEIRLDDWKGFGQFVRRTNSFGALISGGLNGGFSATNRQYDQDQTFEETDFDFLRNASNPRTLSLEPVNLENGSYFFDRTDMTIGNKPEPLGITFSRRYDSSQSFRNGDIGFGWTHNWDSVIEIFSDESSALGLRRPEDAAIATVASYGIIQLESLGIQTAKQWLLKALIANWAVDSISKNARSLSVSGEQLVFIKQPDGSYSSPPGITDTLIDMGDRYVLEGRFGDVKEFGNINDSYRLTTWIDSYGNELSVSYEGNRVSKVRDAFGRTLNFSYIGDCIQSIDDETGRSVGFVYDLDKNLTGYTIPTGHTYTFEYDDDHQITKWINPDLQTIAQNIYNELGQVVTQLSEGQLEREWSYFYSDHQTIEKDPTGAETTYQFGRNGLLLGKADAEGNRVSTEFNSHNRVAASINPRGYRSVVEYDNRQNTIRTSRQFAEENRYLSKQMSYDEYDRLIRKTDEAGQTTTYTYNAHHLVETITNPEGRIFTNVWNSDGTLGETIDFDGNHTQYVAYDTFKNLSRVVYGNGSEELFEYDSVGNQILRTDGRNLTSTFTFDANRNRLTETFPDGGQITKTYRFSDDVETITSPEGHTTTYRYNPLNKLTEIHDPYGEITKYKYNLQDMLETVETPLGATTTTIYDAAKRITGNLNSLGHLIRMELDENGNTTKIIDPLNHETVFVYDSLDRLKSSTNPRNETVSNSYNDADTRVGFTDARQNTYLFSPDQLQRIQKVQTPGGKQYQYEFRPGGDVKKSIKPSGEFTEFTYTKLAQVDTATDSIGVKEFDYDENGNLIQIVEGNQEVSYEYDERNRIKSYRNEFGETLHCHYDLNGNLVALDYPGAGRSVSYTYDKLDRLKTVEDWFGNVTTYQYDADGRLIKVGLPNGSIRSLTYDDLSRITAKRDFDVDGNTVFWETYEWDQMNRMVSRRQIPSETLDSQAMSQITYGVDNEIQTLNNRDFEYDVNGNLLRGLLPKSEELVDFSFNVRDQLVSVGNTAYTYGVEGHRIQMDHDSSSIRYIVNPSGSLSQILGIERSGSTTWYIHGGDLLYELDSNGNPITYHYNYQGSTVAIVGGDGKSIFARASYSPYGESELSHFFESPFLFNGAYGILTDPNGLLSMRARFYDPVHSKRFINMDPIQFDGGNNWYQYAAGNPIDYGDFTGLGVDRHSDEWSNLSDSFTSHTNEGEFFKYVENVWNVATTVKSIVEAKPIGLVFKSLKYSNEVIENTMNTYDMSRSEALDFFNTFRETGSYVNPANDRGIYIHFLPGGSFITTVKPGKKPTRIRLPFTDTYIIKRN